MTNQDTRDIRPTDCLFIMVDIQDKFRYIIHEMDTVIKNADILNRAAEILEIPLIITEQSPEKLSKTCADIYQPTSAARFEKTKFSAFTDEVLDYAISQNRTTVVVYGIEAHICVTQTCLDAIKGNFSVLLVTDAISSRQKYSKKTAVKMLSQKEYIEIVTTEMLLFRLLEDATHPKFREISRLVK